MSEKRKVTVDGEDFEVQIDRDGEIWKVVVGGKTFSIVLDGDGKQSKATRKPRGSRKGVVSGVVSSPIPGKIVSISKAVGDDVIEGEVLMVLEAMKMQNEIQAPVGGKIAELNCAPGETIEANAPLVVIDSGDKES
ncbi:MAG: biotin/lipoyl-containing protein [Candidatus Thermoplasmatota archaeon]|jgi:biotin carboxyl carrier protein|nr:biotin/lipoyl-containing protein [Candidatus Thermoplasmatota archaeon]MED5273961.1 biotin/lipoyl-containing protein [Candidatus Thermoplasmatota archaeon]